MEPDSLDEHQIFLQHKSYFPAILPVYKIPLLKIYNLKTKNFSLGISLTSKISQNAEGYHHVLVLHTQIIYPLIYRF